MALKIKESVCFKTENFFQGYSFENYLIGGFEVTRFLEALKALLAQFLRLVNTLTVSLDVVLPEIEIVWNNVTLQFR